MTDYIPELLSLDRILFEHRTYKEAIFKTVMEEKLSSIAKKRVAENVLGVLRHYFCLSFECLNLLFYGRDKEEHVLSLVCLYELRYHHAKRPIQEVESSYCEAFSRQRLAGDAKANFDILRKASQEPFAIPMEVKNSPVLYNSLCLEVPDFFLKKLFDDYGAKTAMMICQGLHRKPSLFVSSKSETEKTDDMESVTLENKDVIYRLKKNLSLKEIRERGLYPIGYVEALAFSDVDIPPVQPRLLFTGCEDGLDLVYLSLKAQQRYQCEISGCFEDDLSYRSGMDTKYHFHLSSLQVFHCPLKMLKTYTPLKHYDLVVHFSKDLKTGLSGRRPEILPSLNEKAFMKSFQSQLDDFLEAADFLDKDSTLLFVSHALDREESDDVISRFLSLRKDFVLEKKRAILPFEKDTDGGFYAVLKRRSGQNDQHL